MERDIKPTYDELESYVENLQKQLADAQATIAALQAELGRYKEREPQWQNEVKQAKEQLAALQARVKELEEWVQDQSTANLETMRHTDEMQSRAMEAEQQLTQRTAELEALRKWRDYVTAALQRPGCAFEDVPKHIIDLVAELERVRALLLALPKVEGEISERFCTGSYYSSPYDYRSHVTFETALVALLKHRQGMEG